MKKGASEAELSVVVKRVEELGFKAHVLYGVERQVVACLGDERGKPQLKGLETLDGVERAVPILRHYKLAAKEGQIEPSIITLAPGCLVGGGNFAVIAGPCSVESEEQIVKSARAVKAAGANALRGGAYKPRSSFYSFQGLGEEGLRLLALAREETGLPVVTELLDETMLDVVCRYADVIQIGARNMHNFSLLRAVGAAKKPVILKRGMAATVEEFLMSAEYILASGNPNVVLCERGIRTFETATRNTLDLNAVPALMERSHLPVIVDPSHGTGVARYVGPMAKAALACGASGVMIEVHPNPQEALSDGNQSLNFEQFVELMQHLKPLASALNLKLGSGD